jgi:hypothetical protein
MQRTSTLSHPLNSFGSIMEGRSYGGDTSLRYRFGFNTQEKDDEVYGKGNATTAEFWEYDARLGRRLNLDPQPQVCISDYSCFANNPLLNTDFEGDDPITGNNKGDRSLRKYTRKYNRLIARNFNPAQAQARIAARHNNKRWMWVADKNEANNTDNHGIYYHVGELFRAMNPLPNQQQQQPASIPQVLNSNNSNAVVNADGVTLTAYQQFPITQNGAVTFNLSVAGAANVRYSLRQGNGPINTIGNLNGTALLAGPINVTANAPVAFNVNVAIANGLNLYLTFQNTAGGGMGGVVQNINAAILPATPPPPNQPITTTPQPYSVISTVSNRNPRRLNNATMNTLQDMFNLQDRSRRR